MIKGLKYLVIPASFFVGVLLADNIKGMRYISYEAAKGFYCRPNDLRIDRRIVNGKLEVYLADSSTGDSHKVGPKMFVGSPAHRVNSVISIPKEYANKKNLKGLSGLLELYDSFFDK